MAWVSWRKLCLPKEYGGLAIRNMEIFNVSLLGNWRWRLLWDKESMWFNLLQQLYGTEGLLKEREKSVWWKALMAIDRWDSQESSWFYDGLKHKLGMGNEVRFWQEKWNGQWTLRDLFPRLYSLTINQGGRGCRFRTVGQQQMGMEITVE